MLGMEYQNGFKKTTMGIYWVYLGMYFKTLIQ